jgi:hypothetical protein
LWPQGREGSNPFFRTNLESAGTPAPRLAHITTLALRGSLRLFALESAAKALGLRLAHATTLARSASLRLFASGLSYLRTDLYQKYSRRYHSRSVAIGHELDEARTANEAFMTRPMDDASRTESDEQLTNTEPAFPPVADGDPASNPPVPLDDMPVPPLTEPTDVNGG